MKRYLLDTHLIYWWMIGDTCIGKETQNLIANGDIVVSVASLWEMVLKNSKGKLPLPDHSLEGALEGQCFDLLEVTPHHIEVLRTMKMQHQDPFDTLLLAQAKSEHITFLTRDAAILKLELHFVTAG